MAIDYQLFAMFLAQNRLALKTTNTMIGCIKQYKGGDTPEEATKWFYDFMNRNYSSSYKHNMYYAIKWYLRFLGHEWDFKKPKIHQKVRLNISLEKCWILVDSFEDPTWKLLLKTAILTGLRPQELLNLKVADIDFMDETIMITETKTYKDRIIPIGKELSLELRRYIYENEASGKIFNIALRTFENVLCKKSKDLGFHVTPYMLRHTFATQYVENGGNLLMLKSILGHSNIKTTEGYVHESKTMLRKDYERAKPRLFV